MNIKVRKRILAPAKINLFLDIESLRADKYHNILSIMQTVSLYDNVEAEITSLSGRNIVLDFNAPISVRSEDNLAFKAADRFLKEISSDASIYIKIDKNIPASAGLAGGSTNAAAVLLLLNDLFCSPVSVDRLSKIASTLGADVPFCLTGGTKIARGIGEVLKNAPSMPECTILVAKSGEGVATPFAYGELDKMYHNFVSRVPNNEKFDNIIAALDKKDTNLLSSSLYNIFEDVVLPKHSKASKIKETLLANNAIASIMSGSGPSVYGIFANDDDAEQAKFALLACGIVSFTCKPIESIIIENI